MQLQLTTLTTQTGVTNIKPEKEQENLKTEF